MYTKILNLRNFLCKIYYKKLLFFFFGWKYVRKVLALIKIDNTNIILIRSKANSVY